MPPLGRLRGIWVNPLKPHMMLSALHSHDVFSGRKSTKAEKVEKGDEKQNEKKLQSLPR